MLPSARTSLVSFLHNLPQFRPLCCLCLLQAPLARPSADSSRSFFSTSLLRHEATRPEPLPDPSNDQPTLKTSENVAETEPATSKPKRKPRPQKSAPPSDPHAPQPPAAWQTQKAALLRKFGTEGWNPPKRLSPDTVEGIRAMHEQHPDRYTTAVLAHEFRVSPEAIRRILKSKARYSPDEMEERRRRWSRRGEKIWNGLAAQGVRPPKKWRLMGVGRASGGGKPLWKRGAREGKGRSGEGGGGKARGGMRGSG